MNFGFLFEYGGGRLGRAEPIEEALPAEIFLSYGNDDNILIRCKKCGGYMEYVGVTDITDSYWLCGRCGLKLREEAAYNELERENKKFIDDFMK